MQIQPITERVARLDAYTLDKGSHGSFDEGHCAMELVSWLAGEEFTDAPECACPVLTSFVVSWNDSLPDDERTELLRDLLPRIVGTRDKSKEERRALMAADWLVRTYTPAWLRLAGLEKQADALSSLPEITDMAQVPSIRPAIEAARNGARAARAAAGAAAGAAARAAVWAAAGDAAGDAVWAAAGAAAGDAAWDAAGAAVWAAAGDTARAAAWDAAWAAAGDALEPTKKELQQSARQLLIRMIEA